MNAGQGFSLGIFVGAIMVMIFVISMDGCDSVDPYHRDATKIDMVRRGFATWEVQENGDTKFIVRDSCEVK
jgi:hypothetical protein